MGAIQRALTNWAEGGAWYEGVVQNAVVGAVGGAVAGGVVGAMNPQNLPAKVLVGGFVGGGVSAGTQVAFNVAGGRPWNEGVGTAFGMGFANGAIDAFTDYYGDKLVDRAMTPRSARGAVDDVDAWRRPGTVDDADGRLRRWMPEEWDALAVRKAMDVFRDPNASRTERFRAQNRLLDAGVRGPWQGGESLEQMRHRHPTDPDAYWDPTAGKAHEGRWRSRKTGRIVAGDAPDGARNSEFFPTEARVVIDLGSGGSKEFPLAALPELARLYPDATVVGVDIIQSDMGGFTSLMGFADAIEYFAPDLFPAVENLPSNAAFVLGDFSKAIANESADLVTAFAPYPHMIPKTLVEAARIAKPGGDILIVSGDLNTYSMTPTEAANMLGGLVQGPVKVFENIPPSQLISDSYLNEIYKTVTVLKARKGY